MLPAGVSPPLLCKNVKMTNTRKFRYATLAALFALTRPVQLTWLSQRERGPPADLRLQPLYYQPSKSSVVLFARKCPAPYVQSLLAACVAAGSIAKPVCRQHHGRSKKPHSPFFRWLDQSADRNRSSAHEPLHREPHSASQE